MQRRAWFGAAILLQVLVLISMAGIHAYTLATGLPVMLKTVPVDPWDPLRGEYVSLSYEISEFDQGEVAMTGAPYRSGQSIWVLLQSDTQFWNAVSVSDRRPAVVSGQIAIRGSVESYDERYIDDRARLRVRYGIEQFYVPEGQGPGLEQPGSPTSELTVEAVVDHFGRAALRRLFFKGEEIRWR